MIRLDIFMRRHPRLSLGEFHELLRTEYGPLVSSYQTPLGIVRYVQTHRLEGGPTQLGGDLRGQLEEPYDAVGVTWWKSLDALTGAWNSERGKQASAALLAAEAELLDLPESPLWLAHEYPQISQSLEQLVARPNSHVTKGHFVVRHVADMTFDQAQHHWRTSHGPFVRSLAPSLDLLRYQQVHRYETPLEAELRASRGVTVEPYLGHAEGWRSGPSTLTGSEGDRIQRLLVEDEGRFIDFTRSSRLVGKEHVFVDQY